MGLFDVMDDIASKQVLKTETGDNRITGVVIGKVVKNAVNIIKERTT